MPRRSRPHSFLPRRRREQPSVPSPTSSSSQSCELHQSFARVSVADFVDVPSHRFAASSSPRQHKLRPPPSYHFFDAPPAAHRGADAAHAPAAVVTNPKYFGALPYHAAPGSPLASSHSECSTDSIDSNLYLIDNASHVSNLLSIVAPSRQSERSSSCAAAAKLAPSIRRSFRLVNHSVPLSAEEMCSDDTDLFEGHLEHLRFQDATSDGTTSPSRDMVSEREEVSSTSVTNMEPVFAPSPPLSDSSYVPITPFISPATESAPSLSPQSSVHAASLTDLGTIRSVESNDDLFRIHSRSHSPLITHVESSCSADNVVHSSRNLMCRNPASPTKYTFKPTYTHSSPHVSPSGPSMHQPVSVLQPQRHTTPINAQLSKQQVCHRKSYSFSSLSSQTHSEPLTLAAVKKAVDIIDPRVVFSLAQSQSLAFAAAGLFRRKRDSEETFNSSSTEYYEDDYTRFLEKKHCLSPSRLIQHPYISKMMSYDGWSLRSSRARSDSSLSIPTSDEDYFPSS